MKDKPPGPDAVSRSGKASQTSARDTKDQRELITSSYSASDGQLSRALIMTDSQ